MSAVVIDGNALAVASRARTAQRVGAFLTTHGWVPGLATVLVGTDPASEVYVRRKRKAAAEAGFVDFHRHLPDGALASQIADTIYSLARDDRVSGILLQLPLPQGLDRHSLVDLIPVEKDVDGLTTASQGLLARGLPGLRPCTPAGVIDMLDSSGVPIEGAAAVVAGRSELVGHPAAELLLHRNATVTIAHSRTRDLTRVTREADILIAAAGIPGLITAAHVRPGAAVIDVGIHRTERGLTGDVRFAEVADRARWITPVPGGVGPMTIARLLANTIKAAEAVAGLTLAHPIRHLNIDNPMEELVTSTDTKVASSLANQAQRSTELAETARGLIPLLRAGAEQSEKDRCVVEESVTAMRSAGLLHACAPERVGGAAAAHGR